MRHSSKEHLLQQPGLLVECYRSNTKAYARIGASTRGPTLWPAGERESNCPLLYAFTAQLEAGDSSSAPTSWPRVEQDWSVLVVFQLLSSIGKWASETGYSSDRREKGSQSPVAFICRHERAKAAEYLPAYEPNICSNRSNGTVATSGPPKLVLVGRAEHLSVLLGRSWRPFAFA